MNAKQLPIFLFLFTAVAALVFASCETDNRIAGGPSTDTDTDADTDTDTDTDADSDSDSDSDTDSDTDTGGIASSLLLEQVWYLSSGMANNILVDFRDDPPVVTCNGVVGQSGAGEGTAVFTDPKTDEFLFYTDGINVFSGKTNGMLLDGNNLFGNTSATESALITPMFGTDNEKFYIFTNENDWSMSSPTSVFYSEIDLTQGDDGAVMVKNVEISEGNPGEALDMVPHTNGTDFWVVMYEGLEYVRVFLVDETGVHTDPVVSSTGLTGALDWAACINHSQDYDTLVLTQMDHGSNGIIAIADIDRATGEVSEAEIVITGSDMGYHATFSEDGSKLYYSRGSHKGARDTAYQYDLDTDIDTLLGGQGLGASKLAPDGRIYWVGCDAPNNQHLSIVHSPDEAGTDANFVENGLYLEGCLNGKGVPNQNAAFLNYLPPIE